MISVIVPTHNRREMLERKLRALDHQTGEFEVVVVADGCTDGTTTFLSRYQPPYPLRYLETGGRGAAFARNRGAEKARGEQLLFSDDDVIPGPGWVEKLIKALEEKPAVYLGAFRFEDGKSWRPAVRFGKVGFNNVNGVALAIPKKWFEGVGGFAEWMSGYGHEDLELGYRLAKAGYPIKYLSRAEAVHLGPTPTHDVVKAKAAGEQAMRIYRFHRDVGLGLELGVHPALLYVKMAVLPWTKRLLGPRGDYELAYAWGAWAARHEDLPGFASHGAYEDPPASPKDSGGEDGPS